MNEDRKPWERMEGELARWFSRFTQFRLMKPWERSIAAMYHLEMDVQKRPKAPKVPSRWYQISKEWKWEERAAAWDKHQLDERDRQIAAEEAEVWRSGLALRHKRVRELEAKARLIEKSWYDPEDETKINFQWLTPDKLREWRGCLDDIAKEKGERIKKQELTGKDGSPLGLVGTYDPKGNEEILLPKKDEEK